MKNNLDKKADLETDCLKHIGANMSLNELNILIDYIGKNNYQTLLNIGTFNGYSILKINEKFPNLKIKTIDFVPEDKPDNFLVSPIGGSYSKKGNQQRLMSLTNYLKNNNIYNIIPYKCGSDIFFKSNNEKFDIIFIDGDHSYEISKRDLNNSLKVVNKNGIIIMHDIKDFNHIAFATRKDTCAGVFDDYNGKKEFVKTQRGLGIIYP